MAHRADYIQVHKDFPEDQSDRTVSDPVCGAKLDRKEVHSLLFRENQTFYFCSRECRERFIKKSKELARAA